MKERVRENCVCEEREREVRGELLKTAEQFNLKNV